MGIYDESPEVVIAIHLVSNSVEKFLPHIHDIVSDGFFRKTGIIYIMHEVDLKS